MCGVCSRDMYVFSLCLLICICVVAMMCQGMYAFGICCIYVYYLQYVHVHVVQLAYIYIYFYYYVMCGSYANVPYMYVYVLFVEYVCVVLCYMHMQQIVHICGLHMYGMWACVSTSKALCSLCRTLDLWLHSPLQLFFSLFLVAVSAQAYYSGPSWKMSVGSLVRRSGLLMAGRQWGLQGLSYVRARRSERSQPVLAESGVCSSHWVQKP